MNKGTYCSALNSLYILPAVHDTKPPQGPSHFFCRTVEMVGANFLEMTSAMYMNNQCRILLYITLFKNMKKFIPPKSSLIWMTWFWWNKLLHQYHQFRYPILTSSTLEGFQKRFLKQGGKLLLLEFFISFKIRAWSLTLYWGYFCLPMC